MPTGRTATASWSRSSTAASIRAAGNTNLGIKIPAVDAHARQGVRDHRRRPPAKQIWGDIDQTVMENASALPGVWAKGLLYRPPNLTNVFVNNAFGEYDYTAWARPGSSRHPDHCEGR